MSDSTVNGGKPGIPNKTRRSHVVPKFYLKNFANQEGKLWVRDLKDGKLFQSTPEKIATIRDYYRGQEARHEDDLEEKLASIEGDAAPQFRKLIQGSTDIGPEMARFIAWMGARTAWVRRLFDDFNFKGYLLDNFEELCKIEREQAGRNLPFSFHSSTGDRIAVPLSLARPQLENSEWKLEMSKDQFLDLVRMQAYLFQTVHLPRFQWVRLGSPVGRRFITSDRPVSWDVLSQGWQDYPVAMKHPQMDLIFPVSPKVALMAGHDRAHMLGSSITAPEFNQRVAAKAEQFLYAQDRTDLLDASAETIQ